MSLNDPRWGGQGGGDREDGNRGDDNRNGDNRNGDNRNGDNRNGDNRNDDLRGDRNRGGNQGPPDLEEVWRDFNQRLSGMFGGKRSGRGSG
ncbi:MAG: protease modulator HflK N-terminal domain-containing protein, partial [Thauera sp.]|nr:protease modulator HflK N-terminal domain-containing protein [Thauera sp.]